MHIIKRKQKYSAFSNRKLNMYRIQNSEIYKEVTVYTRGKRKQIFQLENYMDFNYYVLPCEHMKCCVMRLEYNKNFACTENTKHTNIITVYLIKKNLY